MSLAISFPVILNVSSRIFSRFSMFFRLSVSSARSMFIMMHFLRFSMMFIAIPFCFVAVFFTAFFYLVQVFFI